MAGPPLPGALRPHHGRRRHLVERAARRRRARRPAGPGRRGGGGGGPRAGRRAPDAEAGRRGAAGGAGFTGALGLAAAGTGPLRHGLPPAGPLPGPRAHGAGHRPRRQRRGHGLGRTAASSASGRSGRTAPWSTGSLRRLAGRPGSCWTGGPPRWAPFWPARSCRRGSIRQCRANFGAGRLRAEAADAVGPSPSSRDTLQTADQASHRGYQTWHRELEEKVIDWLENPKNASASKQAFLVLPEDLYRQPDLATRFPSADFTGVVKFDEVAP